MPTPGVPLEKLGFLTIGLFDGDDPAPGHESVLQVIELGERLGFDSAYLRHRHFQTGISAPIAIMAAASQRTRHIAMGTAVTPLGWENPLRMAEDLATVDILSGGRLQPGFSIGPPIHWDDVKGALYPDTADAEDLSFERVARLLRMIRGESVSTFSGTSGFEDFSARVEPHSPGLADRIWFGSGSPRSTQWAAEQGLNLLTSNILKPQPSDLETDGRWDFAAIQQRQIALFKQHHPHGDAARISQGLVVIPTDTATPEQRAKYEAYVQMRTPRTAAPMGPPGRVCSPHPTSSERRSRSPKGSTPTPPSVKCVKSCSPCPSASTTPTTSRSSPTWRPASGRRSGGGLHCWRAVN